MNLLVWNVTIVSEVESSRPSHHKRNYVNTLDNQEGPFSIPEACEVRPSMNHSVLTLAY